MLHIFQNFRKLKIQLGTFSSTLEKIIYMQTQQNFKLVDKVIFAGKCLCFWDFCIFVAKSLY